MKTETIVAGGIAVAILIATAVPALAAADGEPQPIVWWKVADSATPIPGTDRNFGSFNQPSVNRSGLVVFRARSVGSSQPISGIFRKRIAADGQPIEPLFMRGDAVPEPNNSDEIDSGSAPTGFREFPSIPRIDESSDLVATRGNSTPVWIATLEDGSETSVGTNGVFVATNGERETAFCLLGAVRDAATGALVFPWHAVPDAPEGTRFDVFPGSPSVSDGRYVVTKANWTDPETNVGKTGVYVRDMRDPNGALRCIASSNTVIPGQDPELEEPVHFGSTAPPTAAEGTVVFLGVDSEEAPTMGGLYAAPISGAQGGDGAAELDLLVAIGDPVPGREDGSAFTQIGEAVAFDGRYLAFWGAWGSEQRSIDLACPTDGSPAIIAWCNQLHPDGHVAQVPVGQGIFVHDLQTGATSMIASTGTDEGAISDFVYWNFSGRAPGTGGEEGGGVPVPGYEPDADDGELARWRSATFVAIESDTGRGFRAAFKATAGDVSSIYLVEGIGDTPAPLLSTGGDARVLDAALPEGSVITTLAMEREALRDGWFAVSASSLDEATGESVAGIYALGLRGTDSDFDGDGRSDVGWYHEGGAGGAIWHLNGDGIGGGYVAATPSSPRARLVGSGDANGDGRADMLWYDPASKRYSVWLMNGLDAEPVEIDRHVEPEYVPIAFTDLDDDRKADVVFRRTKPGATEVAVWLMDGGTIREGTLNELEGEFDQIVVGNFDGDRRREAILRKLNSGEPGAVYLAEFDGSTMLAPARVELASGETAPAISLGFTIEGAGDTDGDGTDDVFWRGPNGSVEHWRMRESRVERHSVIWDAASPYWKAVAFPDFSGSGKRGVLFRGGAGETWMWELDGTEIIRSEPLRPVEPVWRTTERGS